MTNDQPLGNLQPGSPKNGDTKDSGTQPERTSRSVDSEASVTAQPARVKLPYRPDIAGLRGIGVIIILLAHADIHFLRNGFIFVDAFYVVSGFLITGLLAKEYERNTENVGKHRINSSRNKNKSSLRAQPISLSNFYLRRAQRILPAALFVTAATVLAGRLLFSPTRAAIITSDALWATFFGANVHFMAQSTDYFQFGAETSPLQHYWSLSIEEQFYFVWPLLFIFATSIPFLKVFNVYLSWRGRLTIVMGLVTLASFIWMPISFSQAPLETYFSTTARAWELGIGGLVALNVKTFAQWKLSHRNLLSWISFGVMCFSMVYVTPANFGYTLFMPVLATALHLGVSHGEHPTHIARLMSAKHLQVIGGLSYAIYLWHWPVFAFARNLGYLTAWWQTMLSVFITFVLSIVTYYFIERPFHNRGGLGKGTQPSTQVTRRATWAKASVSFLSVAVSLSLVLALPAVARMNERRIKDNLSAKEWKPLHDFFDASPEDVSSQNLEAAWNKKLTAALALKVMPRYLSTPLEDLKAQRNAIFSKCLNTAENPKAGTCTVGSTDPDAKVAAIVGDSTALSIAPAVIYALNRKHWRIEISTRGGCPLAQITPIISGKPDYECNSHRERVFTYLARLHPDLVFVSEGSVSQSVKRPTSSQLFVWANAYSKSLSRLTKLTPKTVILFEPPMTPVLSECTGRTGSLKRCFGHMFDDLGYLGLTTKIAAKYRAHLVIPTKWLCMGGFCPAIIDNTPVKWDDVHMSLDMARKLGPLLKLNLEQAGIIKEAS